DGPPAAVVPRLASALKEEAMRNHIAAGAPGEVNYRLHGYFAARSEAADAGATASAMGPATTSMAWTLDLYDGDAHRVVRLSGEEKAGDRLGAAADEQLLRRVARAGMDQVAAFLATSRAPPAGACGRGKGGCAGGRRAAPARAAGPCGCAIQCGDRPRNRRSCRKFPLARLVGRGASGRNPRDKRRARAQSYCQPCRLLVIGRRGRAVLARRRRCGPTMERS